MDNCDWNIDYKQRQINRLEKALKKAEARIKELEEENKNLHNKATDEGDHE